MSFMMGCFMLAATAFFFFKYRPRSKESRQICLLSSLMGLMSLILTDGVLILQLAQVMMQVVMLSCCFLRLRGERKYLQRRKKQLRRTRLGNQTKRYNASPKPTGRACA